MNYRSQGWVKFAALQGRLLLKTMQRLSQAQRAWGDFAEIRELNLPRE
jgi:hypothetical protein